MYWLLVGLVRSLTSSHKEALRKPFLCEDYSDLTSPTSNQIPDIGLHIAVSVVYDTFLKILFREWVFRQTDRQIPLFDLIKVMK